MTNTVRSEKQGKHPGLLSYTWRLLPVWLGNPKNRNRRFCYFNGGEEKGPGEEWVWKAPRDEGQEDKEGTPGQSPSFSHCDPIITARTSDPGASPLPGQFHAPFPAKIPRPTHRRRSSRGSPTGSKPLALFPRCRVRNCCHLLPQQPQSTA